MYIKACDTNSTIFILKKRVEIQSFIYLIFKSNQSLSRIFSFQPFKLCASVHQLCCTGN